MQSFHSLQIEFVRAQEEKHNHWKFDGTLTGEMINNEDFSLVHSDIDC